MTDQAPDFWKTKAIGYASKIRELIEAFNEERDANAAVFGELSAARDAAAAGERRAKKDVRRLRKERDSAKREAKKGREARSKVKELTRQLEERDRDGERERESGRVGESGGPDDDRAEKQAMLLKEVNGKLVRLSEKLQATLAENERLRTQLDTATTSLRSLSSKKQTQAVGREKENDRERERERERERARERDEEGEADDEDEDEDEDEDDDDFVPPATPHTYQTMKNLDTLMLGLHAEVGAKRPDVEKYSTPRQAPVPSPPPSPPHSPSPPLSPTLSPTPTPTPSPSPSLSLSLWPICEIFENV
jgi:hypothetical protein